MRNYIIKALYATFADMCHTCTLSENYAPSRNNNTELLSQYSVYLGLCHRYKSVFLHRSLLYCTKK